MVGEYKIEVNNKYTKYFLTVRRNFTILKGNSATGKTELLRMLAQYEDNGESSGIHISSNVPIHVLRGRYWREDLEHLQGYVIFMDETEQYAKSKEFAELAQKSDNYYFIVNRDPLRQLSYSIKEIYAFREVSASQKYHEVYRVYNEMVPIYNLNYDERLSPTRVITEDSHSGYEFFQTVYSGKCVAAGGKSRVLQSIRELKDNPEDILTIVDGAAFGSEMEEVMNYIKNHQLHCVLYAPESFEYLLLQAGFVPVKKDMLERTYEYADSARYISWEDFYEKKLVELSQGTVFRYQKKSLNPAYLSETAVRKIIKQMPKQVLPEEDNA